MTMNDQSTFEFNGDNHHQEINRKLDQILLNQQTMLENQNKIFAEIENIKLAMESFRNTKVGNDVDPLEDSSDEIMHENSVESSKKQEDDEFELNIDIEETFPINTIEEIYELEDMLSVPEFSNKIKSYFASLKCNVESVEQAFRYIATDAVYAEFNLKGTMGKQALNQLQLFNKFFYNAYGLQIGRVSFENSLRNGIMLSHNRYSKRQTRNK